MLKPDVSYEDLKAVEVHENNLDGFTEISLNMEILSRGRYQVAFDLIDEDSNGVICKNELAGYVENSLKCVSTHNRTNTCKHQVTLHRMNVDSEIFPCYPISKLLISSLVAHLLSQY